MDPPPAALFDSRGKKSLVLAANAPARAAGVAPGMTAPQAVARCPTLLIRTPRPAAEADARAALLAVGFTLAPTIEDTAPGVCTIDLRGTDPSRHQPAARSALAQLAALALAATAGLARTPLLALYAARQATPAFVDAGAPAMNEPMVCESPAREGLFPEPPPPGPLLAVTDEKSFLAPLPLATADPPPELAATLAAWGLRTLGDFTALPRDELVLRFGATGLALWQRAGGGEPRPLHLVVPPREFSATLDLEEPIETLEPLLFLLRRFLDRLALELHGAHAVAAELSLTLRLENEAGCTRHFRLPEPTADAGILFRTLHTHLESLHTDSAIIGLQLHATPVRPLVRQQGLFDTGLRDPHGFADTLARVSALVGADRVGTPRAEDTHRPDAVKLTPPLPVVPPPVVPPVHPAIGLPLRRFRPPLPARLEFAPAAGYFPHSPPVAGLAEAGRRTSDLTSPTGSATPATPADGCISELSPLANVAGVADPGSPAVASAMAGPASARPATRRQPADASPATRQPTYVWTARFHGAIAQIRGPWCSSGDWWQTDRAWARTEWDIALAPGGLYRLLLVGDAWFIEGEYD